MSNQEMNAVVLLAQQGDEEAKTTVVKSVQNMVHRIVYLMNDGKFDEDLASIGYMGFLKQSTVSMLHEGQSFLPMPTGKSKGKSLMSSPIVAVISER